VPWDPQCLGRVCIVTGAARGIGRAIAEALLDEGAKVCFADINGEQAPRRRGQPPAPGSSRRGDCLRRRRPNRSQVREMIDTTVAHFGRLDVMFNNAGVNKPMNFMDVTEENWNRSSWTSTGSAA
jgi:meso-butanediol dehydrogenase/(S,S)-butanediol dehydrogenase/diacetyl reductase